MYLRIQYNTKFEKCICFIGWYSRHEMPDNIFETNPFVSNLVAGLGGLLMWVVLFCIVLWIDKKFLSTRSNRITKLFLLGSVSIFILSSLIGVSLGNSAIDLQLHDTYFVIHYISIFFVIALFVGIWSMVYFVTPKMIKRNLNYTLGKLLFWLTFICIILLLFSMQYFGMATVPRRYYSFEEFDTYRSFGSMNVIITVIAIVLAIAQLIYFINLIYTLVRSGSRGELK